jgi:hypothetical protein
MKDLNILTTDDAEWLQYQYSRWVVCAVPLLRQLVAGFSQLRPGFSPRSVYMEFVVDIVALG